MAIAEHIVAGYFRWSKGGLPYSSNWKEEKKKKRDLQSSIPPYQAFQTGNGLQSLVSIGNQIDELESVWLPFLKTVCCFEKQREKKT